MSTNLKIYKAIILNESEITKEDRVSVKAESLIDAEKNLKKIYGEEATFSLWSEEEADKPR